MSRDTGDEGPTPEVTTPKTTEEKVEASATGGIPSEVADVEEEGAQPVDEEAGDEAAENVVEQEVSKTNRTLSLKTSRDSSVISPRIRSTNGPTCGKT
jgi:hypothetical protein